MIRIAKIHKSKGLILGLDNCDFLQEGHVYDIVCVKDLDEFVNAEEDNGRDVNWKISVEPYHLVTEEELNDVSFEDLIASDMNIEARKEFDDYLEQIFNTDFKDNVAKEALNKERQRLFQKYTTSNSELLRGEMWIARKSMQL
jgi:hypothetical protein